MRISLALLVAFWGLACTNKATIKDPQEGAYQQPNPNNGNVNIEDPSSTLTTAALPVTLDEAVFKKYSINTANMSYRVSYLEANVGGQISFVSGKASLKVIGLPANRAGQLKFELLEGAEVKFRGIMDNLTLVAGENNLSLRLLPVNTTTTAVIDLEIGGTNPVDPPTIDPPTIDPPTVVPTNPPVVPTQPPVQPTQPPVVPTQPPVAGALSFAADIKPIMNQHCTECHHTGKSLDLTKFPFNNGNMNNVVNAMISYVSGGATAYMPPSPRTKLNSNEINKITKWRDTGLRP